MSPYTPLEWTGEESDPESALSASNVPVLVDQKNGAQLVANAKATWLGGHGHLLLAQRTAA